MLKRVFADNYKCMVEFEYKPGKVQLVLGSNGVGKSSLFDLLSALRTFIITDAQTLTTFPTQSCTRWLKKRYQRFTIEVEDDGQLFRYRLILAHKAGEGTCLIKRESLSLDGHFLFKCIDGELTICMPESKRQALIDRTRSAVYLFSQYSFALPGVDRFRECLRNFYCVRLDPRQMISIGAKAEAVPTVSLSNYASWHRYLLKHDLGTLARMYDYLKIIIDGFNSLMPETDADGRHLLQANIKPNRETSIKYDFMELSDGQRCLVCLYTFLSLMRDKRITLCIDEPENYIMLAEIQPWLMELEDQAAQHGSQAIIISHHPELINYFVPRDAVRLSRPDGCSVTVAPFRTGGKDALPPAEIVARGWEDA